jgi:hypothetical protein
MLVNSWPRRRAQVGTNRPAPNQLARFRLAYQVYVWRQVTAVAVDGAVRTDGKRWTAAVASMPTCFHCIVLKLCSSSDM